MHYRIGQTIPLDGERGLVAGPHIPPVWHCLMVAPQKERAAREHLRANGVYAFYPSREKRWTVKGRTFRAERPEVTGYLFAQFRQQPQWDVMKERRRLITGVLCIAGSPMPIPREVIRHLQGLTVEAQRLEEVRRDMLRVREGDKARIVSGPLAGFMVEVAAIEGREALLSGIFGGKAKAALDTLERIIPEDQRRALPTRDFPL